MNTPVLTARTLRDLIARHGSVPRIAANGTPIELERMPCHFGGERWFLICPACLNRATALYARPASALGCRRCAIGRDYLGSRNLTPDERLRRRRAKLAARLGATEPCSFEIPPRPARMWRRTYDRLWSSIARIDDERLEILRRQAIAAGLFSGA